MNESYKECLIKLAKKLRDEMTASEHKLNDFLKQIGIFAKLQVPIFVNDEKGYIADFLIFGNIILEVDGMTHNSSEAKSYDRQRTIDLNKLGYTVYRLKNGCVFNRKSLIARLENIFKDIDTKQSWFFIYKLRDIAGGKKKKKKEKQVKTKNYKYDPDYKSKLYALSGV